ncbi:hypothetical protein V6N13_067203 [Hibiscus sabdariffa]|uniref:Uncharacterized protein n=1 Tax=Hibiscus sabdariffa TaxID=183260 RepID=A0ABR2DT39_9ROSI
MTVKRWMGCLIDPNFSGIRLWRLPPREASSKCTTEFCLEGQNRGKSQTLKLLWPFRQRAKQDSAPSVSRLWHALEFSTGRLFKYQVFDGGGISHFWFFLSKTPGDGIRWKDGSGKSAHGMGVDEGHEFRESSGDCSRRALLVVVPFQVKESLYSWYYWLVSKNEVKVCSFCVELWVSISANLMIDSSAFRDYSCLWLDVQESKFVQSVLFALLGALSHGFIRMCLLCFIKSGHVMTRVIVNLQFHLLGMAINVGIFKILECFGSEVGDKAARDFLSVDCGWGNHVLPDGFLLKYPTTGFLRDGAGLYPFRVAQAYVRLLETSLLRYNKLLSDFNFFSSSSQRFCQDLVRLLHDLGQGCENFLSRG